MKKEELAVLQFRNKEVKGFSNWIRAAAHICDHLLTRPEMEGWCALADCLEPLLNTRAAFEEARRMWSDGGDEEFRRYYDPYIAEIAFALSSGGGEGWVGEETEEMGTTVGSGVLVLGINGVLVIMERGCVITSYLPGTGIKAVRESRNDEEELTSRRINPLPREKDFSDSQQYAAKEHRSERKSPSDDTLSEMEKKLRIFKKSAKNVRTNNVNWYSMNRMNLKRLTLEEWEELYVRYAPANEKVDNEH